MEQQLQVTLPIRQRQAQAVETTAYVHLPDELLMKILEQFCFHCQNPGEFPHADSQEVRQNKATLARLCRASTRFRDVAEPILYHYYATGNCNDFLDRKQGFNDHLLSFVSTLAARPTLATNVVSMQLVNHPEAYRKYDDDKSFKTLRALIKQSDDKGSLSTFHIRQDIHQTWCNDTGVPDSWKQGAHRWLMCLAMVLSTKLRDVIIAMDDFYMPPETYAVFRVLDEGPRPEFPDLTKLGLISPAGTPYQLAAIRGLVKAAPKLESLYVCTAGHDDRCHWALIGYNPWPGKWGHIVYKPLIHLKKLVISDIYLPHLGDLVDRVRGLEELELYWTVSPPLNTELVIIIERAKATLKRLCLSYLPGDEGYLGQEPCLRYPPIKSLAQFPKLEDITIDCRSLYREVDKDTYERLTSFLPKTIRRFRVSYVTRDMTKSLSQLADTTQDNFPELTSVVVGVTADIPRRAGAMRMFVEPLFVNKGIEFAWREDTYGPSARTLVLGATMPDHRLLPWKEEDEATN
ncbi:hypothetical protein PG994_010206 [Apiospora phragmitis]|uniref:F-box domain-containing protein n=1 Tax=Apiospora phragmitis TaxID=2905665 RepID=A0ABR1TP77_9PEZI